MASFVVDEDLPEDLAEALRSRSRTAITVRQAGMRGASDEEVFESAQSRAAIIVTEDLDFADILAFPLGTHFGIVVLRIPADVHYSIRQERLVELFDSGLAENLAGPWRLSS